MFVEPYGHQLRHSLFFGQPLFHQQLQLDTGGKSGHSRLQILRQQTIYRNVRAGQVAFQMGLAVVENVLFEEIGNQNDSHDLALKHQSFGLFHPLYAVSDPSRRRRVDHLRHFAGEGAVVLVHDGDRNVACHSLV